MFTENGIEIDPEHVNYVLNNADVLTIAFPLFSERLLFDTRTQGSEGPMVAIVEPVASVQERYHWLGQHRGGFGAPTAFSFFAWPHTIRSLVERDVLAPLRERLEADARESLDAALAEALAAETTAIREMIRGSEAWPAVWMAAA